MLLRRTSRIHWIGRSLLLVASIFLPSQPVLASITTDGNIEGSLPVEVAKPQVRIKRTRWENFKRNVSQDLTSLRNKLGKTTFTESALQELAQIAYGQGPTEKIIQSDFISQIEFSELHIKPLTLFLGTHTQTSLGNKALENMILTYDKNHMSEIQGNLKRLVEDDEAFNKIERLLSLFAKNEKALLNYWDPKQNTSGYEPHLFYMAKQLNLEKTLEFGKKLMHTGIPLLDDLPNPAYYFVTKPSKFLLQTDNPYHKQIGVWIRILASLFHWFYAICIAKNMQTMVKNMMLKGMLTNPIKNAPKEFWGAMAATVLFWMPTNQLQDLERKHKDWERARDSNSPFADHIADSLSSNFNDIVDHGSYADVVLKTAKGLHGPNTDIEEMGKWITDTTTYVASSVVDVVPGAKDGASNFLDMVRWLTPGLVQAALQKLVSGTKMALGDFAWLAPGFYYLSERTGYAVKAIMQSLFGFAAYHYSWQVLQDHATHLASCLRSVRAIKMFLEKDAMLQKGIPYDLLKRSLDDTPTREMRLAMKMAHKKAFKENGIRGGHAIILHEKMLAASSDLQPALHGIGYLDALFSIAKLIRQHKGKPSQISFVEWLPDNDKKAQMEIHEGTLLIMPNAQPNSMHLGLKDESNKAILTGPNGAGKSVFIKMVGSNTVLAHAFGIAAAGSMKLHWLDRLRTSIEPGDSLEDDLSRMQAQNVRMENVVNDLTHITKNDPTKKGMFLTDEPLSGTTARAAARKLSTYCEKIGAISQMVGVMATHNEEPTKFEDRGFLNYQVCVKQVNEHVYIPSFKVERGIPEWWFSKDPQEERKVDNFIAYTVAIKHKENIQKQIDQFNDQIRQADTIIDSENSSRRDRRRFKALRERLQIRVFQLQYDLSVTIKRIERLESGTFDGKA